MTASILQVYDLPRFIKERQDRRGKPSEQGLVVETSDPALLRLIQGMLAALPDLVRRNHETAQRERLDQLVAVLAGDALPTLPGESAQTLLNAQQRAGFLREFPLLTSAQVADLSGSGARNRAAQANRWKTQGKVFAVSHGGQDGYPAFQFDAHGRPLPIIAELLNLFAGQRGGWQLALWFAANNAWLPDAARPVDLLDTAPDAVLSAARNASAPLPF